MLSKKKKIFVLVGMVLLLVAAGCLNIFLVKRTDPADGGEVTYGNFFTNFRSERTTTRNETLLILDAIINNTASTVDAVKEAEAQKLELTKRMKLENDLEGLIKALGFQDAVVTDTKERTSVMIKDDELTSAEVAQVLAIVVAETDKTARFVSVIPV